MVPTSQLEDCPIEKPKNISVLTSSVIEVSASLSSKIIRKGDAFNIYVDIYNALDKPITLTDVRLVSPIGFIQLDTDGDDPSLRNRLRIESMTAEFRVFPNFEITWKRPFESEQKKGAVSTMASTLPKSVMVQPKEKYRVNFNLQAGPRIGLRPRPDTYAVSAEVTYSLDNTTHHRQISLDLSIFPPVSGMLGGTLLGSFLGTITRNIDNIGMGIVPVLFVNLILGFIAGVILMRKKDVQPFVTVEDFWGGTLLGFLVGFAGVEFFMRFAGIGLNENSAEPSGP